MDMLRFELPEVIYRVTKTYDFSDYPELSQRLSYLNEEFHFKDINLAEEYYNQVDGNIEKLEFILDGQEYEVELLTISSFTPINVLELIPKIIDL